MSDEKTQGKVRARLMIRGRVQGVFFRASTVELALRLGLGGWVRNCRDGSVEVVAEGQDKKVEELIQWCRQGPAGAQVRNVQLHWEEHQGVFDSFSIKR